MQIPILLEPIPGNSFRATVGQPLDLQADGATADEAFRKLRAAVDEELKRGKKIVPLELSPAENPWLSVAGTVAAADPLVEEWKDEMKAYRHEKDDDPDWR